MENIGKRFSNRVIISVADCNKNGAKRYLCRCDCGSEAKVVFFYLRAGKSQSCILCARRERHRTSSLFNRSL